MPYPQPSQQDLGRALRARRLELGLTQEQLGQRCDMDLSYIGRLERGQLNVSWTTLMRVMSGLDAPVWWVIAQAEPEASRPQIPVPFPAPPEG